MKRYLVLFGLTLLVYALLAVTVAIFVVTENVWLMRLVMLGVVMLTTVIVWLIGKYLIWRKHAVTPTGAFIASVVTGNLLKIVVDIFDGNISFTTIFTWCLLVLYIISDEVR